MGDAAEKLPELEPLLTAEEVAPLLKMSRKSLYNLIEDGTIGRAAGLRRIGRRVRFYRPDLVAWMAGQEGARKRRSP
jgi:excisionase family DNA binding protein